VGVDGAKKRAAPTQLVWALTSASRIKKHMFLIETTETSCCFRNCCVFAWRGGGGGAKTISECVRGIGRAARNGRVSCSPTGIKPTDSHLLNQHLTRGAWGGLYGGGSTRCARWTSLLSR
jgi:hypothetical protein